MLTRFTLIVNNLYFLRKTFTNEEKLKKIRRCIPKCKWRLKVMVKSMSFKVKKVEEPSSLDEESDDVDPLVLVARGLSQISKMKRNLRKTNIHNLLDSYKVSNQNLQNLLY